ncbi:uncharacterized protein [Coffea arabica]|uniref:SWIM-type domain-containing protein n=1 Tax=Coffea arabica TaxID=13443 RepID=A0A6P6VJT7_COFAR|nr:uncharacterized protein LOC113724233 [Coffea arabica]
MWIYNSKDEIEFQKGQLFTNVDAFRAALKDYVIQKGFPILRLKNEKSRVTAVYGVEGCQWRIHASPVADSVTFQIKSYQPEHTCVMDKQCAEATSDWMAKKLVSVMRDHPNMTSKGVEAELLKYGVRPSKMQIFRAKNKTLAEIEGTHAESYTKLPRYAELLRKYNPNSICKIHYDRPNILVVPAFLRIFVSFTAQKLGFLEGCRPFMGFDGCFLKGPFGGVLLTAVALDANNSIFSLAFAGLNLAYEEMIPEAIGRHCCRHICSNFKSQFPGILLSSFFWKVAKSYDAIGHNDAMASIKDIDINAWKYLDKIPRTTWCRHVFSTELKCDNVTNNFTESFNAWIGDRRGKPILTLVDGLRRKFMKKMHKRYQKGCTLTGHITPRIVEKLKEIGQASRKCQMHMASEDTFQVGDMDRTYIVNLRQRICDCDAFQISRILCKHATLGVIYRKEKLENYCEVWFTKDMYLKTYSHMIHPIPHVKRWPPMPEVLPTTVLSPPLRRAPGRPRVNRRREVDETACTTQEKRSSTLKCGNCGAFGHNKRTCKGAPVQKSSSNTTPTEQMAIRRGRPGKGMANTGLSRAVLWDHATRNAPIVHSNQGSNPSLPSQNGAAHIQVNVQTIATTHANRKRGRRFRHNPATSATKVGGRVKNFNSALTNPVVLVPPNTTSQNASSRQNLFLMEKEVGEFHDSPLRLEEAMVAAKTFNSEL